MFFVVLADQRVSGGISTLTLVAVIVAGIAVVALFVFCGIVLCIAAVIKMKKKRRLKLNFVKTLNDEDESIAMKEMRR